ncbi:RDD family protein [Ramlibacter alkalitolerans]|uniref:RDD family protein n=1 Tax=Ramlibacter alkalitolerans TaxID=2039631 RepID=A0ABS1JT43_9BURK|nr:RDD family protein [Ramlibacter alkalitolerans]MBL0427036.1 RDD family protein [Ramlibacter alkalitolerans]
MQPAPRYQTAGRRALAFAIDALVLAALHTLLEGMIRLSPHALLSVPLAIAYSGFGVAYSVCMHARFGQTLGKWIARVRVVPVKGGQRITYRQAILRDIVPCLLLPVALWYSMAFAVGFAPEPALYQAAWNLAWLWAILELLTMMLNDQRRAIHDWIAGTVVVRVA